MSRTKKRTSSKSPIKKYVNFSGGMGAFTYWDKDKEERVELDSLKMTLLDTRNSISGYSESRQASINSNMVESTAKEPLEVTVFSNGKKEIIAEGLYNDFKDSIKSLGGKFTANIIGLVEFNGEVQLTNLQLSGAALGSWIDFESDLNRNDIYNHELVFKVGKLHKRGKDGNVPVTPDEEKKLNVKISNNPRTPRPIWFFVPEVELGSGLSDDDITLAEHEDVGLQDWFNKNKDTGDTNEIDVVSEEVSVDSSTDGDDLPF